MTKNQIIKIFSRPDKLFQFAADDFMQRANTSVREKSSFSVVLSGGNTPKSFFDTLANDKYRKSIPWGQIQFFFGDERYVAIDNEESNYHMAYEHLFRKVPVNLKNIYRIPTDLPDPHLAAKDYAQTLRKLFHVTGNAIPVFDLVYLGLGDNAHTASLMPLSDIVIQYAENKISDQNDPLVVSLFVPELKMYRITLTPRIINHSKNIIFLATGVNKAPAIWEVLSGPPDPKNFPAQLIHSIHGNTIWYVDKEAANRLDFSTLEIENDGK